MKNEKAEALETESLQKQSKSGVLQPNGYIIRYISTLEIFLRLVTN